MYKAEFVDWSRTRRGEDPELVMTLEVPGESRTEVLYNLLTENWEQFGEFIIDDEEYPDIIFDFIQILCDPTKYEGEEAEYRLKLHSEMNLDLRPLLDQNDKNINAVGIIEIFCGCVKESWEFQNDSDNLNIDYKVYKV